MTCPKCQGEMNELRRGGVTLAQCTACHGIFLERAELGDLIDQENEWHSSRVHHTQPIPPITPGMSAPPASTSTAARSYIDTLFG